MHESWVGVGEDLDLGGWLQRGWDNTTRAFFEDEAQRRAREAQEDAQQQAQYEAAGWAAPQANRQAALDRQYTPDPLRWIQERAEEVRHNAPLGLARAAVGGVTEPFATAGREVLGGLLSPVQQGMERYGWNPGPVVQDLAAATGDIPVLGGAPLLGGPTRAAATVLGSAGLGLAALGGAASDALTGRLPDPRADLSGANAWGIDVPHERSPWDPRANLQRSAAMAGPAEMAVDLAAGNLPFGMAATAGREVMLGSERVAQGQLALGLPSRAELLPATGNALQELFRPGMGNLGAYAPPALLGAVGFVDPSGAGVHRTDEEGHEESPGISERVTGAVIGALAGAPVGFGAAALERRILPRPTSTLNFGYTPTIPANMSPQGQEYAKTAGQALSFVGTQTGRAETPGGVVWHAIHQGFLRPWIDELSPMTLAADFLDAAARQPIAQGGLGRALNASENLNYAAQVLRGAPDIARDALGKLQHENFRVGGVRNDEFGAFEQLSTLKALELYAQDISAGVPTATGATRIVEHEAEFFGPYLKQAQQQGNAATRATISADRAALEGQILQDFSGRPDILQRFEAVRKNFAQASEVALEYNVDRGVLDRDLVDGLKALYGTDYGLLVNPARAFSDMRAGSANADIGRSYTVTGTGVGRLHEEAEPPVYSVMAMAQKIAQHYETAERNLAANKLYDLYDKLGVGPNGQPRWADWENWLRPNDYTIKPGGEKVWDSSVDLGMARVPLYRNGEYTELLAEKSLADALVGANATKQNVAMEMFAHSTHAFSTGVTELAPWFFAVHGTRQFQEFVEKLGRGKLGEALGPYFSAIYHVGTKPLADFAVLNPNHPIVAGLPGQIAARLDRVLQGTQGRAMVDLFESSGGGGGLSQSFRGERGARSLVGGTDHWYESIPVISGYADFARFMTNLFDEAPRVAGFGMDMDQVLRSGRNVTQELPRLIANARTMTNDYNRTGYATRVLGQFMPLLNARKEGAMNSFLGAVDDPQRFATRMTAWFGLPLVAAYAANRMVYGDAYDDISPAEKDLYFHVPYGWWTDETGRNHPLPIKIVKSPFVQVMTAPLEHLLDANYHLMADDQYLAENQRTQRPTQRMWVEQMARMSLFEGRPDAFADIQHLAAAAVGLVPIGTLAMELANNEDLFTGKPIIPPERRILPNEYQYGVGTSLAARALGQATHVSPTVYDRFAADLFGTAGRVAMHAPDTVFHILQKNGLVPSGDPFAPQSMADLPSLKDVPPELAYRFLDQLQHEDQRPWEAEFLGRFLGTTYGARSVMQRAHEAGPEDRHHWEETLNYQTAQQAQIAKFGRLRAELENNAGQLTQYAYRQAEHSLNEQQRGALEALAQEAKLKGAWVDYAEREAAKARLPGTDVENFKQGLARLPEGVDANQLLTEYRQPPALAQYDPAQVAANPRLTAEARNLWLRQKSQEYKVDISTLLSYVGAQAMGQELPGMPVPGADMELLRARHRAPPDPRDPTGAKSLDPLTTPIDQFSAAQEKVLQDTASSWGVPKDQVRDWLNSRLHLPGETVGLVQAELQRAQAIERVFHEPDKYPRYATPNGAPVGRPEDWDSYDARLGMAKNAYGINPDRWPEGLRTLDELRRYGEAHRYLDMYQYAASGGEPLKNLVAWERFYGTGRNATLDQWAQFYNNPSAKYAGAQTVEQALTWDMLLKLHSALPPGPVKAELAGVARQIQRQARPAWLRMLDNDGAEGRLLSAPGT